jgi:hypothetical protein
MSITAEILSGLLTLALMFWPVVYVLIKGERNAERDN